MDFDLSLYNDEFFEWHYRHARQYAVSFMEWYVDVFAPNSVVDFGCGIGSFLEGAHNRNVPNILGYEIGLAYAKKYIPVQIQDKIFQEDITIPLLPGNFDCVICIEVAEHIHENRSEILIKNLINAASTKGVILFTAAPEDQGGCGHINCHPMSYWEDLFESFRATQNLTLRDTLSSKMIEFNVPRYIVNNLRVFQP